MRLFSPVRMPRVIAQRSFLEAVSIRVWNCVAVAIVSLRHTGTVVSGTFDRTSPSHLQGVLRLVVMSVVLTTVLRTPQVLSQEPQPTAAPRSVAERPWATVWMSSLGKFLAACDVIYGSIDRLDLADSLEDRLTGYNEFRGLDRTAPLGIMWTWDNVNDPPATIFLPVHQIDDLLKTATFGIVDYHKVKDDQYEIERPGAPYHVLVRSGYALFGEDIPSLHALRESPERLTRDLRDKYDAVLMLDQRQVPREARRAWIDDARRQLEPWLQQQDDEPVESAVIRRALGKGVLDGFERLVEDVQTVLVGVRIDRRTYQVQLDLTLQAEPGTTMAAELNRLVVRNSEFTALVNREASAGLAINWPLTLLGPDIPAIGGTTVSGRLDLGLQLIGSNWGDMTLVAGIRGPEANALNIAMPSLLTRMEKSADFTSVKREVAKYRDVVLHQVVPTQVPDLLQALVPPNVHLIIGQGKQTVWLVAGPEETLMERLQAAIDAVADAPETEKSGSVMQARLSVSKWPAAIPVVDLQDAREGLGDSKDGFSLKVQPVQNGLKIQLTAEEGLLRVIGHHWARRVDHDASIR